MHQKKTSTQACNAKTHFGVFVSLHLQRLVSFFNEKHGTKGGQTMDRPIETK